QEGARGYCCFRSKRQVPVRSCSPAHHHHLTLAAGPGARSLPSSSSPSCSGAGCRHKLAAAEDSLPTSSVWCGGGVWLGWFAGEWLGHCGYLALVSPFELHCGGGGAVAVAGSVLELDAAWVGKILERNLGTSDQLAKTVE
uniref:Uncharacterized protein n=1 Tax=Oryza meridionalis TaxID=40149 RepID=A0A0E0DZE6_9ORYZ